MIASMASKPPQTQTQQPGREYIMTPRPRAEDPQYRGSGKLQNKVAIITGGDSGIGRAVALAFIKEGAHVVISYLNEHIDAEETKKRIIELGGKCELIAGNIGDQDFCELIIQKAIKRFGKVDILVNNAAEQHPQESLGDITTEQLERTFRTNIFAQFYLAKAALQHMKKGSAIINTASVTAYRGSAKLLDYSATKGAIVSFTRSLSQNLASKGIRVNAVSPGPIWTPLIPSTFDEKKVERFGDSTPLGRVGQPEEVAPSFVFLASDDASYMTGQVLHPNGGEVING